MARKKKVKRGRKPGSKNKNTLLKEEVVKKPKKTKKVIEEEEIEEEETVEEGPKRKKIKDMTEEEYKEYKKEYAKKYNDKKRQESEEVLTRKMGKKTKEMHQMVKNNSFSDDGDTSKRFSSYSENKKFILNPLPGNLNYVFSPKGLNCYAEMKSSCYLFVGVDGKKLEASIGIWLLPKSGGSDCIFAENVKVFDFSDKIKELTFDNFREKIQKEIESYISIVVSKWTILDFCKEVSKNTNKQFNDTLDILWTCIDKDYVKKEELDKNKFYAMFEKKKGRR